MPPKIIAFPLTIRWPPGLPVAVPESWTRQPDGTIEAVYTDKEEMQWCLYFTRLARRPNTTPVQAELIPSGDAYYQRS